MKNDSRDSALWLKRAKDDLRFAKKAFEDEDPAYDLACYLSQQCSEKSLKALLIFMGIEYPYKHQTSELVKLLPIKEKAEITNMVNPDSFALIDEWVTVGRYPGDAPEATVDETRDILQSANTIYLFAEKKILP